MAKELQDRFGRAVRLTEERTAHILEHAEMEGQLDKLREVLQEPDVVVQSQRDPEVRLYHKHYPVTPVTEKYLLVAVKVAEDDAFVLTTRSKRERGYGKNESVVRQRRGLP